MDAPNLPDIFKYAGKVEESLKATENALETWHKYEKEYSELRGRLTKLPSRTSYEIMVPFGKKAFMPGNMIHTNEILVLLGDNWFVDRSASQAVEIVERRQSFVKENIKTLEAQLEESKVRASMTPGLYKVDSYGLNEEGLPFMDIHEEIEAEEQQNPQAHASIAVYRPAATRDSGFAGVHDEEDEAVLRFVREWDSAEQQENHDVEDERGVNGSDDGDDNDEIDMPNELFGFGDDEEYDEVYEEVDGPYSIGAPEIRSPADIYQRMLSSRSAEQPDDVKPAKAEQTTLPVAETSRESRPKKVSRFKQAMLLEKPSGVSPQPSSSLQSSSLLRPSAPSPAAKPKVQAVVKSLIVENVVESINPDEVNNEMLLREWQSEYHRRRQDMIAAQGGFTFADKEELEIEVVDESPLLPSPPVGPGDDDLQDFRPRKVSKFKAARLGARVP